MRDNRLQRQSSHSVDDAAADWFARIDGGLTPAEQLDFEKWLAADPRHREVWEEFGEAFTPLESARRAGLTADFAKELSGRHRHRLWRTWTLAGAGLAAAAAVAFALLVQTPSRPQIATSTESGVVVTKPETRRLEDGTLVELNRGAILEVAYTTARRGVRLIQGEAHFSVTKDPSRPFIVSAHGVEVRAVGTAFSVLADTGSVDVVITEGRVAIARVDSPVGTEPAEVNEAPVFADAGNRVVVPITAKPQVIPMASDQIEKELSWRSPKLELSGTPLSEAVAALNRVNRVQLKLADPVLADMRVSGVFRVDQAENFARILAQHYHVRLDRMDGVLTLRRSP